MVPSIRVQDHPQDSGRALRDSPLLSQHKKPGMHRNRYCRASAAANSAVSYEREREFMCECVCERVCVYACVCACVGGAHRWLEVDATTDAAATGDDPR